MDMEFIVGMMIEWRAVCKERLLAYRPQTSPQNLWTTFLVLFFKGSQHSVYSLTEPSKTLLDVKHFLKLSHGAFMAPVFCEAL